MVCYFDCNTIQIFKFMAGVSLATSLHQDIPDYDLGQIENYWYIALFSHFGQS